MLTVRADTTFDDGTYGIRIFLCKGLKPVSTKTPLRKTLPLAWQERFRISIIGSPNNGIHAVKI